VVPAYCGLAVVFMTIVLINSLVMKVKRFGTNTEVCHLIWPGISSHPPHNLACCKKNGSSRLNTLSSTFPLAYWWSTPNHQFSIKAYALCLWYLYYLSSDSNYFQNSINDIFTSLNKWFKAIKLALNFDKTDFMNNKTYFNLNIGYDDKTIEEVETAKFLGM
jgi:hypothetical protein